MEKKRLNKKILKIILYIIVFILMSGLTYWLQLVMPPSFSYSKDFYLDKKVQTYDISLSDGNYRLGFYIGKKDEIIMKKNDGDYLLKYYCDGKLIKNSKNLKPEIDGTILHDSLNSHMMVILDQINIPNNFACNEFKLKINTIKNFSAFKELDIKSPIKLYIRDSHEIEEFSNALKKEREIYIKKYPRDFPYVKVDYLNDSNVTKLSLMKALFKKDLESFKNILTNYNLSPNLEIGEDKWRVKIKRTPLIYAAYFNDLPTVKYLIKNGADIDHQDRIKTTALQYAIKNNATEVVRYLLKEGANKELACFIHEVENSRKKVTPLTYAIKHEYYELFTILLENGFRKIDLDCKDIDAYGMDDPIFHVLNKDKKDASEIFSKDNPFAPETKVHIYHYLYEMQYPVRFLKLFKKYGLHDEKYEKDHTKEWFQKDFEECQTRIYGSRCNYILEHNITLDQYDIYKFFEIIGYENRQTKKVKRSK